MNDRDHFAAAALTGLIVAMRDEYISEICESAYGWADAMLRERDRLQRDTPGYTAGISPGCETKPTLTDAEREAVAYYIGTGGPDRVDATLRGLLERIDATGSE